MRGERLTLIQKQSVLDESETAQFRDFSLASTQIVENDTATKEQLDFDIVIANTLERRKQCCQLAFEEYFKKGYVAPSDKPYIATKFDLVNDSIIFAVRNEFKEVIGTLTIIPDSPSKLPSDMVFGSELDELRNKNLKLFEFSRLAIRNDMKNQFDLLASLINYGGLYANYFLKSDMGIIEVNPHHSGFYEKLLLSKRLTEVRPSPFVADAPAILLSLPLKEMMENTEKARDLKAHPELKKTYFPNFFRDHSIEKIIAYIQKAKNNITPEEIKFFNL
jgi:hypothetical protein